MLPINLFRENPELVKNGIAAKHENVDIDLILSLDKELRILLNELNDKRAQRNATSEKIGKAKVRGEKADDTIKEMQKLSKDIKTIESNLTELNNQLDPLL